MITMQGTMAEFNAEAEAAMIDRGVLLERQFRLVRVSEAEPFTPKRIRVSNILQHSNDDYDCYIEYVSGRVGVEPPEWIGRRVYFQAEGEDATSALVNALEMIDHHLAALSGLDYRVELKLAVAEPN